MHPACMHACMQCKEWMESFLTNDFVEEKSLVDERVAFIALATRLASIISCREHAITARINWGILVWPAWFQVFNLKPEFRRNINALMRTLYRSGAWLTAEDAATVASQGLVVLRANKRLAELSVIKREPRFPLHCKLHMLFHTFRFLQSWSRVHKWCENPLVDACQVDEAMVGIISRFSRRVSPKTTVWRTYDLYLTSLCRHLRYRD